MRFELSRKLRFLFDPNPYKIAYGGRDGTKSWGFAAVLLELGAVRPLRILCVRETQTSIAASVHQLLSDTIARLEFGAKYEVQQTTIIGSNGTQFIFAGLKHNIDNIKSLEGADIVWVEEAQSVSKASWDKLLPTIRKQGAEVWVSFNPHLATDNTYLRWVLKPPPGAIVVKIGWEDNRWLSDISKARIEHMRTTQPADYDWIYGGNCKNEVEGAIYAAELKKATEDGRICAVPYDRTRPVDTFWDLGFGDTNCIWMAQSYGGWFNFIDYLEGSQLTIADYCVQLQSRGYVYGVDWLPHDGVDAIIHTKLAADRSRSPEMLLRGAGRQVRIAPKLHITSGLNAVRTILPQCRFDEVKCADGLQALRHYQWGPLAATGRESHQPLHNWASHAADALRTAGVSIQTPQIKRERERRPVAAGPWS